MIFRFRLVESKEDIQKFVDKFGQETYDDFTRLKDRIKKVEIEEKPVSLDILYHVKNTSKKELLDILKRAENREYKQEGESQQVDVEGKLIPTPTNTKKIVYKGKDGIVYFITDIEDMIDVSSEKYGRVVGEWCVAGRYETNGKVKVSQAKEYFYDYMNDHDLDGYYVWVTDKGEKYCILFDEEKIHSIWSKEDTQLEEDVLTNDIRKLFEIAPVIKIEDDSLQINGITLLSVADVEKLPTNVLKFYDWWWLRSPGLASDSVTFVDGKSVNISGSEVNFSDIAVRPALIISNLKSLKLKKYQKVLFKDFEWTVISGNMILCNDNLFGKHYFNRTLKQGNDYETSGIKKYIHKRARELGLL